MSTESNEGHDSRQPKKKPIDPRNLPPQIQNLQKKMEHNLGLVRVLDYMANEPFDLIYQQKTMDTYKTRLFAPFSQPNEADDQKSRLLREDFNQLKIEEKFDSLIKKTEGIALSHGLKEPYAKKIQKTMGIFTIVIVGLLIVSMAVDFGPAGQYVTFIMMMGMCFGSKFIQKNAMLKWAALKKVMVKDLLDLDLEEVKSIKLFIQYVLDDVRDRLLENHLPLQTLNFVMISSDYDNLQVIRIQNVSGTEKKIVQFTYPEGVEPFEVPDNFQSPISRNVAQAIGNTSVSSIAEDDDNDLFVILKNAIFNEDSLLVDFEKVYGKKIIQKGIEEMLNNSDFDKVNDITLLLPNSVQEDILCECSEPVQIKSLKNATLNMDKAHFEFFLGIGEKCPVCSKNPFVIIASPGNQEVPEEFEEIFGQSTFQ